MMTFKRFFTCGLFILPLLLTSEAVFAKKEFALTDWQSPIPSVRELGLDYQHIAKMIGEGQLMVVQNPTEFDLWTEGKIKSYEEARIATVMIVINKPKAAVRDLVLDVNNYSDFMKQLRDTRIEEAKDGHQVKDKHFLAKWTQVYQIGLFALKAKFSWQYTLEENGDVSLLLHDGDVGAAAGRMEFIEVSENKTLLVYTSWQDLDTAKLSFRVVVKANPDIKTSMPSVAASLLLQQYKEKLDGLKSVPEDISGLPDEPITPTLTTDKSSLELMLKLAKHGTAIFVQDKQWINHKDEITSVMFASSVKIAPHAVDKVRPLTLDVTALPEIIKEIKKTEVALIDPEDPKKGERVKVKMKIGLGFVGFSMRFGMDLVPETENIIKINNGQGGMSPLYGAHEFYGFEQDGKPHTLEVLSQAGNISDDAPYVMRTISKKLPKFDYIQAIFAVLPQIEKQQRWVEKQIEKQEALLQSEK